jgi:hypothetical protein
MDNNFKVGDPVVFGRTHGEKTHGVIFKVNGKTLVIEQTEARGTTKVRTGAVKWRVAASLVRHADGSTPVAKPKRSRAEIEQEIQAVDSKLSPENLFWDGERPRGQALAAARVLNRRMRELETELKGCVEESLGF